MRTILAAIFLVSVTLLPTPGTADALSTCHMCHSSGVPATDLKGVPLLAGQHPAYIVKQLERFADARDDDPYRRTSTIMAHRVTRLARSEWQKAAEQLSAQKCVFGGDPKLPPLYENPCASCHGARGLTDNPAVPNLAGQDLRYMFYQYQKLREPYMIDTPGSRSSLGGKRLHPVMGPMAAQISDNVVSIMIYYSRLPCR